MRKIVGGAVFDLVDNNKRDILNKEAKVLFLLAHLLIYVLIHPYFVPLCNLLYPGLNDSTCMDVCHVLLCHHH